MVFARVGRVGLVCAALVAAVVSSSTAEARSRHHGRHHVRTVERVHATPQESAWQQESWGWGARGQNWGDASGTWGGPAGSGQRNVEREPRQDGQGGGLKALVARHAAEAGVPFALADAVVRIESGYNPRARNRSGAMGLMQIKAQTARGQGFAGHADALLNPETNLRYAMRYLATAYKMSGGDVCGTVMRYQSGHYARRMSGADRSYCGRARKLMASA